jgi:NAD(P)-dependent dehydrogenase (short-subunit alcohol dehydrogenase family)
MAATMKSLRDKTILVTGAGGGFGREMICQFVAAGSHLVLSDLSLPALHRAVAETLAAGGRATPGTILGTVEADLSDRAGTEQPYRRTQAIAPTLDILVNNAGIAFSGPIYAVPCEKMHSLSIHVIRTC